MSLGVAAMRGIPRDLDLPGLVGSNLHMVSLGKFDVTFQWNCGLHIQATGSVFVSKGGEVIARWREGDGWDDLRYQQVLNGNVSGFEVLSEQELVIRFEGGNEIHLFDDSDQYESLKIWPVEGTGPNGLII